MILIRNSFCFSSLVGALALLARSDGAANDLLGESVAIDGATIVAGTPQHATGEGAAYVYAAGPGGSVSTSTTNEAGRNRRWPMPPVFGALSHTGIAARSTLAATRGHSNSGVD